MERKVSFYSDGVKIGGVLFEPDEAKERSCPGVVLCSTMSGHKDYYWYPEIARRCVAMGCVALIWDFRGIGDSEGEYGLLDPVQNAEDMRSALTYLEIHPKVDSSRLAIYGASWGGGMVPYVAGVDERVTCAISVAGWADGERWMRSLRRYDEWLEFLEDIAEDRRSRVVTGKSKLLQPGEILTMDRAPEEAIKAVDRIHTKIPGMDNYDRTSFNLATAEKILGFKPIELVDRISPRAILYIVAEQDIVCPADQVIDMYKRTKEPKQLWVVPGVAHHYVYEEPYASQVWELTRDWLKAHLHLG